MADVMTPEKRSRLMARIRGKDTTPELTVRRMLHAMGYRFRLHRRGLPGTPDLVFPGRRKIIFVHGCFWHAHQGCPYAVRPKTRPEFWERKLEKNVLRDKIAESQLILMGWEVLAVWECWLREPSLAADRMRNFLGAVPKTPKFPGYGSTSQQI
jgi:DNA mismatch endonuclease (patch repair protein)